jgi:hypothetical protein
LYELTARANEFHPALFAGERELTIELSEDFYAAMNLQAARERDNRAALLAAAKGVVALDSTFRALDIISGPGGYELRARKAPSAVPRLEA